MRASVFRHYALHAMLQGCAKRVTFLLRILKIHCPCPGGRTCVKEAALHFNFSISEMEQRDGGKANCSGEGTFHHPHFSPEVGHAPHIKRSLATPCGVTIRATCVCKFARGLQEVLCRSWSLSSPPPTMHDVFGLPLVDLSSLLCTTRHTTTTSGSPAFPIHSKCTGKLGLRLGSSRW